MSLVFLTLMKTSLPECNLLKSSQGVNFILKFFFQNIIGENQVPFQYVDSNENRKELL